jgi:penicillin-binding protein 1A
MPAIAWQKYMAYAHTNIEIKPVSGIDFKPAPFVQSAQATAAPVARPPEVSAEAAQKLLDLATDLHADLDSSAYSGSQQASLVVTSAPQGL